MPNIAKLFPKNNVLKFFNILVKFVTDITKAIRQINGNSIGFVLWISMN